VSRFPKGQSGNPNGRPKGTRSAPSLIRDLLRDGVVSEEDMREVVAVVVSKAKDGDLSAASLLLDRTIPKLKPAADAVEEAEVAEAITAARIRGLRDEGGLTLEALVAASMGMPEVLPPAAVRVGQGLPAIAPGQMAPLPEPPAPHLSPPRSIRIPMPNTDPDTPYSPLEQE